MSSSGLVIEYSTGKRRSWGPYIIRPSLLGWLLLALAIGSAFYFRAHHSPWEMVVQIPMGQPGKTGWSSNYSSNGNFIVPEYFSSFGAYFAKGHVLAFAPPGGGLNSVDLDRNMYVRRYAVPINPHPLFLGLGSYETQGLMDKTRTYHVSTIEKNQKCCPGAKCVRF